PGHRLRPARDGGGGPGQSARWSRYDAMTGFLIRRILGALVILMIISAVTFYLFYAVPRDPARAFCGKICRPETLDLIRHNLGMDEPLFVQYWHWLTAIVTGREFVQFGACPAPCLGYSFA